MGAERREKRPTDDPLQEEIGRLAEKYGDQEVLRICLWTVQKYAELGATKALLKRRGDPAITCESCRERAALREQFERNMKRLRTDRPIGGAAPEED
jgi:hypothetical protein